MLHIRPEISCFETLYYVFAILSDTLWNKTSAMIFSKYTYLSHKFHMVCAQTQFLFFVMPDICLNKNDVFFSYTVDVVVDTDEEIVKIANMSIPEIFEKFGVAVEETPSAS